MQMPPTGEAMTPPVTVMRVDHVGVIVADIDAAVEWYAGSLGLTVVDRWEKPEAQMAWAHLEGAGYRIEFVQRAMTTAPSEGGTGFHHIALVVADCAQVSAALVAAGGAVVFPPSYFDRHDMDWSFVRDPFGNILEIVSYRNNSQDRNGAH
jgi:methylmalonyl-CoA/ethylmalonyl-CoA epimerase